MKRFLLGLLGAAFVTAALAGPLHPGRLLIPPGSFAGWFGDAAVYWDFSEGSLVDKRSGLELTFTRASNGTYFDSAGVLQTATTNEARFDHDPATGQSLGLLIEESRMNLTLRSEAFDHANWTKTESTISTDAIVAPDGKTTADGIIGSTNDIKHFVNDGTTVSTTTAYTITVFAKAGNQDWILIEPFGTASPGTDNAFFDLSSGSIGTTEANVDDATIKSIGNGWYRVSVTITTDATDTLNVAIASAEADNDSAFAGDATTVDTYIWGAQLEAGAFPTSYITTTSAAVTRAADVDSAAVSDSSTLYVSARTGYGAGVVCQIDNGTENERYRIERNASNEIHVIVTDGGVEQANLNLGAVADNTEFKVAARFLANDIAASLDGGAVATDTGATLPTVTTIRFGMDTANDEWNDAVAGGAVWGSGKANAVLQSIAQ